MGPGLAREMGGKEKRAREGRRKDGTGSLPCLLALPVGFPAHLACGARSRTPRSRTACPTPGSSAPLQPCVIQAP